MTQTFDFQKALLEAFRLGEMHCADADSEYFSHNKRAATYLNAFHELCKEVGRPTSDLDVSLAGHNVDPDDWDDATWQRIWHRGFEKGYRAAEEDRGIKGEPNVKL